LAKIKAATLMIGASAKSFDWRTASPDDIGCEVGYITGKLTMCLHDRYSDAFGGPAGWIESVTAECREKLAPLFSANGRREGVSGCCAGAGRDRCVFVGCARIHARRDRSLSGIAMESTERQSLEIRCQVAGATCETRTATAQRAYAMKTWLSGDVSERLTPGDGAKTAHELEVEIEQIRARLAANEAERKELEAALRDLVNRRLATAANCSSPAIADAPRVIAASPAAEKVALFRRLFAGRADVFPVRWENRKTTKSGYAPGCANEWVKGICGKPQVKCGECPHQAFIPVTDGIIEKHLRGEGARGSGGDFVAGVYPLLPDETCWFLACARGTSSSRHARRSAPRFDSFAITCGQAELHEAGDGLVERISILISTGKHHAALERCNDLKGPRFRIRSADPLG
jgi:hypothetical protein